MICRFRKGPSQVFLVPPLSLVGSPLCQADSYIVHITHFPTHPLTPSEACKAIVWLTIFLLLSAGSCFSSLLSLVCPPPPPPPHTHTHKSHQTDWDGSSSQDTELTKPASRQMTHQINLCGIQQKSLICLNNQYRSIYKSRGNDF